MFKKFLRRFIGDKAFYRSVLIILLPLVVQQGITSAVNLLDNLMVGSLGEESLSAVSVVNQILMVFNLTIFGGLSGVSIFGAQFAGKGDVDGMRQSFRAKMYFGVAVLVIGIALLSGFGKAFISMFLKGEVDAARAAYALSEGSDYLNIMLAGLLPFMLVQVYAGSMREMGKTVATMVGSVIAILTNLVLNFLLIYPVRVLTVFGATFTMWGAGMGVRGAALATVIARFVEMFFVLIYAHLHQQRYIFLKGAFRNGYVPLHLLKRIAITGTPLLINEMLWSLGMTFINQCYSTRGMAALAALNITSTAWNLFCIIMFAMGNAVSIMVGQCLGQGDKAEARSTAAKLLFITVVSHIVLGLMLAGISGIVPHWFAVTDETRHIASQTLVIAGLSLPIHAFLHAAYFTIRSGGKTFITFLFDSVYTWCVPAVLAFVLSRFTHADVVLMYFCIQFIDVVKAVIGIFMLKSDFWANNIVSE
ncbi:MAG: MATE family efflux transporter [Aristaeellaceae bacterium]